MDQHQNHHIGNCQAGERQVFLEKIRNALFLLDNQRSPQRTIGSTGCLYGFLLLDNQLTAFRTIPGKWIAPELLAAFLTGPLDLPLGLFRHLTPVYNRYNGWW